jgi:pimeloyl-ACP methyl ester carboxylesterase
MRGSEKKALFPSGFILLWLIIFSLTVRAQNSSGWELREVAGVPGNPALIHMVWQHNNNSANPLNRIALHRVVKRQCEARDRSKVIMLLPGTWQAGGWSAVTDKTVNTLVYLADNGYDVYTMDFRTANLPGSDYDQLMAGGPDLFLPVTDWTYGAFREDVKLCVEKIKQETRAARIFMSGFSRGATLMFIYANKYQNDLKGLVSLDGDIKDNPPSGTQMDESTYRRVIAAFKAGLLSNPADGSLVLWMYDLKAPNYDSWKLAGVLPESRQMAGASLPSQFATVSDLVADEAHNLWGAALFSNYYGRYIDKAVLVKVVNEFTRYYPSVQSIEDLQLAAYADVPYFDYDDNPVNLPALAFLTRLNCPDNAPPSDAIPNLTVSRDVTIVFLSGYGHMDLMFGVSSLHDVKQPLLDWLNRHAGAGGS